MECPICISKMTKSRVTECAICEYKCCSSCLTKYLTSIPDDANCPNCRCLLSYERLLEMLPATIVNNQLKNHRKNVLFERQMALMASTASKVDIEVLNRQKMSQINDLRVARTKLQQTLNDIDLEINRLRVAPVLSTAKREFMHRCARPDCNGFLNSSWRCMSCSEFTCSSCGCVRLENHVCDKDNVESFQSIKRDCRRCPSCATYTYKTSGCDQMFCMGCHKPWSWSTGRVINGTIHNPHFYEWQRQGGSAYVSREASDIPCGGCPDLREVMHVFGKMNSSIRTHHRTHELFDFLKLHEIILHIENVEFRRYGSSDLHSKQERLRILYALNELTEEKFKDTLQCYEKAEARKVSILLILQTLVHVFGDSARGMVIRKKLDEMETIYKLCAYVNEELNKHKKIYKCVVPQIVNYNTGAGNAFIEFR